MKTGEKGWTSGLLSLGLPGLGQVYQRRFLSAMAFFIAFALALYALHQPGWVRRVGTFFPSLLLWGIALAAAFDSFRGESQDQRFSHATSSRRAAYLVAAALGFFLWFVETSFGLLPYGDSMRVATDVEDLARAVRYCRSKRHEPPSTLGDCGFSSQIPEFDPWGEPYRLTVSRPDSFELGSSGEDRRFGSEDDRIYRFRY